MSKFQIIFFYELFNANIAVGNLRLFVGKLQLPAHPTFLTHDAAG